MYNILWILAAGIATMPSPAIIIVSFEAPHCLLAIEAEQTNILGFPKQHLQGRTLEVFHGPRTARGGFDAVSFPGAFEPAAPQQAPSSIEMGQGGPARTPSNLLEPSRTFSSFPELLPSRAFTSG